MGVEPTAACSAQPATNFEDWGAHRDTTTPTHKFSVNVPVWVLVDYIPTLDICPPFGRIPSVFEGYLPLRRDSSVGRALH